MVHKEDISERVSALETDIKHVVKGLTSLEKTVGTIAHSIESVSNRIAQSGKMNWGLLIAIFSCIASWSVILAGLLICYGNMALAPLQKDINYMNDKIQTIEKKINP